MKTISVRNRNGSLVPFLLMAGTVFGLYYYQSRGGHISNVVRRLFGLVNQGGSARHDPFTSTTTNRMDLDQTPAI
jgi:hypothetical protein